ncbi:hypothetical protein RCTHUNDERBIRD_45 [Rhodobacter phage RcThunderbird]|nr:hypothetical protein RCTHUNDERBIRD_45 [Rhodobacter phage RcThunderbird]
MIYFVSHSPNGPFKIGRTEDARTLKQRLKTFSTGYPFKLKCYFQICLVDNDDEAIDDAMSERLAHLKFEKNRISGEWFDITLFYIYNGCTEETGGFKAEIEELRSRPSSHCQPVRINRDYNDVWIWSHLGGYFDISDEIKKETIKALGDKASYWFDLDYEDEKELEGVEA